MAMKRRTTLSVLGRIAFALVAALILVSPFGAKAEAQERRHREEPRWWRHGDIRRFHEQDFRRWRAGRWVQGRHTGRLGWWWVVGGVWYFYPAPVYPYPDPYLPPVVQAPPAPPGQPPVQYWYYCQSLKTYYPYATTCPEGWMQVAPQAPPR